VANPVIENLTSWKNDAAAGDTNLPVAGSNAGTGQAQELAGNIRLLKSELRGVALNASWERWKGARNLAGVADIAFLFNGPTQFFVNDDFTSASRLVATVGRRVKATIASTTLYGVITAASAVGSLTTVTVLWQSGALDATLSEVQFGPELRAVGTTSLMLQNATGVTLGAGQICSPSTTFSGAVSLVDAHATIRPVLVARQATANIAFGEFLSGGLQQVDVSGAVVFGNYLVSFAAANASAQDSGVSQAAGANPPAGTFGVALASGTGLIPALLFGCTIQGNAVGLRTVSVSAPSGGHHGDIWYQVNVAVWINDFGTWFKCAP
jgi:hypothetical protein